MGFSKPYGDNLVPVYFQTGRNNSVVARLHKHSKVVLPDRRSPIKVMSGESWRCIIKEYDRFMIATPIEKIIYNQKREPPKTRYHLPIKIKKDGSEFRIAIDKNEVLMSLPQELTDDFISFCEQEGLFSRTCNFQTLITTVNSVYQKYPKLSLYLNMPYPCFLKIERACKDKEIRLYED